MKRSLLVAALQLAPVTLAAQSVPPIPTSNANVRAAVAMLERDNAWTLRQQTELTEIPAPPFKEAARAADFKRRLEAIGFRNVRVGVRA